MAIKASAKKAIRSSEKKRVFNLRRTRSYKNLEKEIAKLLKDGKVKEAEDKFKLVQKAIDKASKMNTIKKNTADRKKSRLSAQIKKAKSSTK